MQKHEQVVTAFLKKIYQGSLKPDARLPTEKQLAEQLKVDRGALRVGLRQLESLGVIRIRHGDGMYVRDYMKDGGLDFLKALFMVQEAEGTDQFIDDYLLDEIWEFWIMLFPAVVEMAAGKYSNQELRSLKRLLDEELEHLSDRDLIVELEVKSHDLIVAMANNTILALLFNSCLPLRRKIVAMQIMNMTDQALIEHIESKRALLSQFTSLRTEELGKVIKAFRARMEGYRNSLRRRDAKESGAKFSLRRDGGRRKKEMEHGRRR